MLKVEYDLQPDLELMIVRFEFDERPWTVNAERAGNRWQRATNTKHWREAFAQFDPPYVLTDATVEVTLQLKGRLQDTAACMPAVKASIDGMVDANLFLDDTGDHVRSIIFNAPLREKENKIMFTVTGRKNGSRSNVSSVDGAREIPRKNK
jgi:hypothetical protein